MINGRPREIEPMLARGGVMGALIRERDWADTAVGVMEAWPQSLRTALSVCLLSKFPMFVFWGPDMVQFYLLHTDGLTERNPQLRDEAELQALLTGVDGHDAHEILEQIEHQSLGPGPRRLADDVAILLLHAQSR